MLTKVEGFILSTVDYGESSLVLNLLTKEYGTIGIMAKGVKSMKNKMRPLVQKYTYGFFYIYYKEDKLSILKDVDIINPLKNIHNDLLKISYLAYISDLTKQVTKENNDREIYSLFISTILKIENDLNPLILTNILEVKYLKYLGVGLSLDCCSKCGGTNNIVTINGGGLICQKCYNNEAIINKNIIKLLRMYNHVEIKSITKLNIDNQLVDQINLFLNDYYNRYTGIYLKSKNFLEKIKNI